MCSLIQSCMHVSVRLDNCLSDASLVRDELILDQEMEIGARGAWLCMRLEHYRIFMVYPCSLILNLPSIFGQWTTCITQTQLISLYMYTGHYTMCADTRCSRLCLDSPNVSITNMNNIPMLVSVFSRTFEPPVVFYTCLGWAQKVSILFVNSYTYCLCELQNKLWKYSISVLCAYCVLMVNFFYWMYL